LLCEWGGFVPGSRFGGWRAAGGIYEVGALIALSDSLAGIDLNDIDVYVGVSSDGFVAAALANGISPTQMYRLFIDDGADASLSPALFLRPALGEFARRGLSLPCLFVGAALARIRKPDRRNIMESIAALSAELGRAIPTGLFDQRALDRFLTRLFSAPGRSNDFRKLGHRLFVIATNLDTGASTTFGGPGFDHVPITRAIEASAALPGLFPAVDIDSAHYVDGVLNKTLHASVPLEAGVRLLLCIDALVPFDASPVHGRGPSDIDTLAHGGLPMVLAQTFRAIIHSRMEVGMDRYRRNTPTPTSFCSNPIARTPPCFSPLFSAMHAARICAKPHIARRAKAWLRAARCWSLCSRGTASA
jgi:NTE family protein